VEELRSPAPRDIGVPAINILMSFGAIAVAAGILALNPSFATGAVLGVALVMVGLAMSFGAGERWSLLGTAGTVIGALLLSGGAIGVLDGGFAGFAFTAILLLALAVVIRSGFLMALVPLALAAALGSSTGYFHATYMLIVSEPTITIACFAFLALAAYLVSNRVGLAYEGLAIVAAMGRHDGGDFRRDQFLYPVVRTDRRGTLGDHRRRLNCRRDRGSFVAL
jgi:hypothetical protein